MVVGIAEMCRGLAAEVARGGLEPEVRLFGKGAAGAWPAACLQMHCLAPEPSCLLRVVAHMLPLHAEAMCTGPPLQPAACPRIARWARLRAALVFTLYFLCGTFTHGFGADVQELSGVFLDGSLARLLAACGKHCGALYSFNACARISSGFPH